MLVTGAVVPPAPFTGRRQITRVLSVGETAVSAVAAPTRPVIVATATVPELIAPSVRGEMNDRPLSRRPAMMIEVFSRRSAATDGA